METIFTNAFKKLGYEVNAKIVRSNKDADFQCDDCFKLAKAYHKAPTIIANEVVNEINESLDTIKTKKEPI